MLLPPCLFFSVAHPVNRATEVIGATYLRMRGFAERVPHLIEGHVLAKRYLCFADPGYHETLSPASRHGGPTRALQMAVCSRLLEYTVFERLVSKSVV